MKKPVTKLYRFFIALISTLFLFMGCIKEDLSDCPDGLLLDFQYMHFPRGSENNGDYAETDHITVYIFDENDLFVKSVSASKEKLGSYTMDIPLDPGIYKLIAWAGLEECYLLTPISSTANLPDQLFLRLRRDASMHVTPPALLFYGSVYEIEIVPQKYNRRTIDLWRITNEIRVTVDGLETTEKFDAKITDSNGLYSFTGEIREEETIIYAPSLTYPSRSDEPFIADFSIMKLEYGRTPILSILYENELIFEKNLISELINKYPQVDFRFDHYFLIEIIYRNYIIVSIKINGWEIIEENIDS